MAPLARQVTCQVTVAVTTYTPPGCVLELFRYVYPHEVRCADDGLDVSYGVPGPSQVTTSEFPMAHVTRSGAAVVVTVTPPADADALTGRHTAGSTQSHDSRFTKWFRSGGGFISTPGNGNRV